jgi:predicted Zn-dependent protease with MMP-like domain
MDTSQDTYNDDEQDKEQDEHVKNEQSARTFFALLSFLVAMIFLVVFISNPLDDIARLLVLCAIIVFSIIGTLLLDKRRRVALDNNPEQEYQDEEGGEVVDLNETDEDEDTEARRSFKQLVREALNSIPEEFHEMMQNLVVIVEDEPDVEVLTSGNAGEGSLLLGLYRGVPLTAQGRAGSMLPERITIYRRNIEKLCQNDPERIRAQVRHTILHEVAHHFGMGHDEMPIWIQ